MSESAVHAATERLKARLREAGLRATQPRLAVLGHLVQTDGPRSHADVVDALEHGGWDRATLYRNLNDLASAGIVRRLDVDHTWVFEVVPEHDAHDAEGHPHFVCVSCGDIQCLGEVELQGGGATAQLLNRVTDVQLRGVCEECS